MSNYPDYLTIPAGAARVVDQSRASDGSTALRIHNFNLDERGNLDSTFHIMPLIGAAWVGGGDSGLHPDAFYKQKGCIGMCFARFHGLVPQILFITETGQTPAPDETTTGVFQFAPWRRNDSQPNGGLIGHTAFDGTDEVGIVPLKGRWYPPQFEQVGNRVYFTLGDGTSAWVWDGERVRRFGYTEIPSAPVASGPGTSSEASPDNAGGFSVRGRIGTTDAQVGEYGALLEGHYEYAVVFEGPDGAYSATSPTGDPVFLHREQALINEDPDSFRRRFWLRAIPKGPDPTAARILLRTANLRFLPEGVSPELRFLHRLPSNVGTEWIDDIPDGELGPQWEHRMPAPYGFYFMAWLNGSLFCLSTDGNPSRAWYSEQGGLGGATPESFLADSWFDVYPSSGPIRGVHKARLAGDSAQPCILVFTERAVHYIAGQYPDWDTGTVHDASGLCGPNLVQSTPDGAVVWFGAGTFWQLRPDGQVVDIGGPIREDLARVNHSVSTMGSSYVDGRRGEARFVLAVDDMDTPAYQFIWDFRFQGWRTAQTVEVRAALRIEEDDLTLLSGEFNSTQSVWVIGRTYPHYSYTHPTATFQSGWLTLPSKRSTPAGSYWIPKNLLLTLEERAEGTATISGYTDWDEETAVTQFSDVPLCHPENTVPYWSNSSADPDDIAYYGTDVWRTRRVFSVHEGFDTGSTQALSVKLTATTPVCILGMDVRGALVAQAGGRTPAGEY